MKLAQNNPPIGGSKTKTFSPNSYALFQNFPHKRVLSNEIFWPKKEDERYHCQVNLLTIS